MGQDIGILPGGWVAFGGWRPIHGVSEVRGGANALFLRATSDGSDTPNAPTIMKLTNYDPTRVNRQIPVWDDKDILLPGDFSKTDRAPRLCHGLIEMLTNATQQKALPFQVQTAFPLDLPAEQLRQVLPDNLLACMKTRQAGNYFRLSGLMALAENAVVVTGAQDNIYLESDIKNWRAIAIKRADRTVLWDVPLPAEAALSGMSLTRGGDVLVPLIDGRIICIGARGIDHPIPAVSPTMTQPGLIAQGYASDAVTNGYYAWTQANFDIMTPIKTSVIPALFIKDDTTDGQTVLHLTGYLDVPTTGKYHFRTVARNGTVISFTIFDSDSRFAANAETDEVLLEQGKHPISVIVLQSAKARDCTVKWEGPGIERQDIPASVFSH